MPQKLNFLTHLVKSGTYSIGPIHIRFQSPVFEGPGSDDGDVDYYDYKDGDGVDGDDVDGDDNDDDEGWWVPSCCGSLRGA